MRQFDEEITEQELLKMEENELETELNLIGAVGMADKM